MNGGHDEYRTERTGNQMDPNYLGVYMPCLQTTRISLKSSGRTRASEHLVTTEARFIWLPRHSGTVGWSMSDWVHSSYLYTSLCAPKSMQRFRCCFFGGLSASWKLRLPMPSPDFENLCCSNARRSTPGIKWRQFPSSLRPFEIVNLADKTLEGY